MTKPDKDLPTLTPQQQAKIDQFFASCQEVLDRYVAGFEIDMNRYAVKHGPMDETRAHADLSRILLRDVPPGMLAGLLAEAILRGIAAKRKGRG